MRREKHKHTCWWKTTKKGERFDWRSLSGNNWEMFVTEHFNFQKPVSLCLIKRTIFSFTSSATVTGWRPDLVVGLPDFLLFSCSKSNSSSLLKSLSLLFPLARFLFIPPFPETSVTFLRGIFQTQAVFCGKEETTVLFRPHGNLIVKETKAVEKTKRRLVE